MSEGLPRTLTLRDLTLLVIGTVIGGWTPLYGLGSISAHLIGGRIKDLTQSFQWAFLVAIVLALMAGWVIGRLKEGAASH